MLLLCWYAGQRADTPAQSDVYPENGVITATLFADHPGKGIITATSVADHDLVQLTDRDSMRTSVLPQVLQHDEDPSATTLQGPKCWRMTRTVVLERSELLPSTG